MEPQDAPHDDSLTGAAESKPDAFDPYYTWLGIPPNQQPADHYRLLGVQQFEASPDVISHALDQRMAYVRTFQNGRRGDLSQTILNELASAGTCLLDPELRRRYDAALRSSQDATAPPPRPAPAKRRPPRKADSPAASPSTKPPSRAATVTAADRPHATVPGAVAASQLPTIPIPSVSGRRSTAPPRSPSRGGLLMWTAIVVVAAGGLAGLIAMLGRNPDVTNPLPADPLDGVITANSRPRTAEGSANQTESGQRAASDSAESRIGRTPGDAGDGRLADQDFSSTKVPSTSGARDPAASPLGDSPPLDASTGARAPDVDSGVNGGGSLVVSEPLIPVAGGGKPATDALLKPWPESPGDDRRGENSSGDPATAGEAGRPAAGDLSREGLAPRADDKPPLGLTLSEVRASQEVAHRLIEAQWKSAEQPFQKLDIGWKLLRQAREEKLSDVERAGLYLEAFDIMRHASGLSLALPIAWEAADELPMPTEAWLSEPLKEEAKRARAAERLDVAQLAWLHARRAAEAGLWELATDAAQMAASQASRGPADFKRQAVSLRSTIDQHDRALDQARRAEQALQAGRDDAGARLLVAKSMCLLQGRWDAGLPLLAEVEAKAYAQVAQTELSQPAQPVEQVALGDQWWSIAESETPPWSDSARRRAAHWYDRAAPLLAGLEAQRVAARMDQTAVPLTSVTKAAEEAQRRWQALGQSPARLAGRLLIDQRDAGTRVEYEPGVPFSGAAVVDFLQTKGVAAGHLAVSLSGTLELAEPTRLGFVVSGGAPGGGIQWSIDGQPILSADALTAEPREVWLTAGPHQLTWTLAGPNLGECRLLLFDARTGRLPAIAAGTAVRPGVPQARQRIQIARQPPN